jgi:hypothetical protein
MEKPITINNQPTGQRSEFHSAVRFESSAGRLAGSSALTLVNEEIERATLTSSHCNCLMSAEMDETRPCHAVLLARLRQRPRVLMRILWDLPLLRQGCTSAAQAGRVDFAVQHRASLLDACRQRA